VDFYLIYKSQENGRKSGQNSEGHRRFSENAPSFVHFSNNEFCNSQRNGLVADTYSEIEGRFLRRNPLLLRKEVKEHARMVNYLNL